MYAEEYLFSPHLIPLFPALVRTHLLSEMEKWINIKRSLLNIVLVENSNCTMFCLYSCKLVEECLKF